MVAWKLQQWQHLSMMILGFLEEKQWWWFLKKIERKCAISTCKWEENPVLWAFAKHLFHPQRDGKDLRGGGQRWGGTEFSGWLLGEKKREKWLTSFPGGGDARPLTDGCAKEQERWNWGAFLLVFVSTTAKSVWISSLSRWLAAPQWDVSVECGRLWWRCFVAHQWDHAVPHYTPLRSVPVANPLSPKVSLRDRIFGFFSGERELPQSFPWSTQENLSLSHAFSRCSPTHLHQHFFTLLSLTANTHRLSLSLAHPTISKAIHKSSPICHPFGKVLGQKKMNIHL